MDRRIEEGSVSAFSVVVFDLNNLKYINDTYGHEVGDAYIKDACKLICGCFQHSPVFRVGGDEFIAILEGEDCARQDDLLTAFEKQILENLKEQKSVVAFGCSRFVPGQDKSLGAVAERADAAMYQEKALLKSLGEAAGEDKPRKPDQPDGAEDSPLIHLRKHILIADDVEANRELLGDLLQEDYNIFTAADGVQALDVLQKHRDEIALVILDLYMPNMTGREVLARMQVDEHLSAIPVIVLTVDEQAELECLRMGAMDFIPKPYPDIEIVKARIAKCIELPENRALIRHTQRDKLTGLFHLEYFLSYVNRYDQYYHDAAFDAIACHVNHYSALVRENGQQFGGLVLRSIGIGIQRLNRRIGGIGCRRENDAFYLYCPHQEDYEQLLREFVSDLFADQQTAEAVTLRFGVFANAQQEPDIDVRFVRAESAAQSAAEHLGRLCEFFEYKAD